jgi:hypothetical protein
LVDVDGVLCPFGCQEDPEGFRVVFIAEDWVWVSEAVGERLRSLAEDFKLIWATGWEEQANIVISPLHGIGPLPVITFSARDLDLAPDMTMQEFGAFLRKSPWKMPWIEQWTCQFPERAIAWIDDQLGDDAERWAEARDAPTLLVRTDPTIGITEEHCAMLRDFAGETVGHHRVPQGENAQPLRPSAVPHHPKIRSGEALREGNAASQLGASLHT